MDTEIKLDLLKAVLTSPHSLGLTEGSPTHCDGLGLVNTILPHTQDGQKHAAIIHALLPEGYTGDLEKEIPNMVKSGIAKGLHLSEQDHESGEEKQSQIIIKLVEGSGVRFFRTPLGEPYASIPSDQGGRENVHVRGSKFKSFLQRSYFLEVGKPPANIAVKEAKDHFAAMAELGDHVEETHVRVAPIDGGIVIDLGDQTNRAVKIDGHGVHIIKEVPVNFVRPNGAVLALPEPEDGFDPEELRAVLGMNVPNFILFTAFCISALNPSGPYFVLQIHGEQGSGKTNVGKFVKDVVDPNIADKLRMPKSEADLVLQAQSHWSLNYENTSFISNDLSDLLCMVATGGALAKRKLYTDDEQVIMVFKRPAAINGIGNFVSRPDLQERSIPLNLTAIPEGARKTERELQTALDQIKPKFLGYLYKCVSQALANLDKVEPPRTVRMADAAHWLVAAEPATGFEEGAILEALEKVQRDLAVQSALNDNLTVALLEFLSSQKDQAFEGRVSQLHEQLGDKKSNINKRLPGSPATLSNKLQRMIPGLRQIGVIYETLARRSEGQFVSLHLTEAGQKLAEETAGLDKHDGSF